jgi:FlaA1/EpsC-like NDP-sugar epimerase
VIEGGSILVTGGTGAFGNAFARHLLGLDNPPKRLVIYSRGEYRQFLRAQELQQLEEKESLRFMIGDVRDRSRLRRALGGVEIAVHAAALKRIEVGQYNPIEMVRTNIEGAINLIEAAQDARVKKVVFLSSDKAFERVSPYGQTKRSRSLFSLKQITRRDWLFHSALASDRDKAWRAVDIRCDGWQLTWYCSLAQRSLIRIGFIIKLKAETI